MFEKSHNEQEKPDIPIVILSGTDAVTHLNTIESQHPGLLSCPLINPLFQTMFLDRTTVSEVVDTGEVSIAHITQEETQQIYLCGPHPFKPNARLIAAFYCHPTKTKGQWAASFYFENNGRSLNGHWLGVGEIETNSAAMPTNISSAKLMSFSHTSIDYIELTIATTQGEPIYMYINWPTGQLHDPKRPPGMQTRNMYPVPLW